MIVFVHIEKAAGTTLNHILRCNFPLAHYDVRPFSEKSRNVFLPEDLKLVLKINPFTRSISGHAIRPFVPLDSVTDDLKYITVLREPVQRYISRFYYLKKKFYPKLTFQDFINDPTTFNFQTKKIAGSDDAERAITILKDKFFLVGLTEEFDTFLLLLQHKLLPFKFNPCYKPQNTAANKKQYNELRHSLLTKFGDMIKERNSSDIKLYRYVRDELFPEEKALLEGTLEHELKRFRQQCKTFTWPAARYLDYIYRKLYIDIITGLIRIKNGLPYKGSY